MSLQKKQAYHHGDLRTALISAGRQIIETQGIDALNLRDVASDTGVTQAAPYSHFKNKTDLTLAIAEQGYQDLAMDMVDHALGIRDSLARIEMLIERYITFANENQALFQLMNSPIAQNAFENRPTLAMSAGKAYSLLSTAISGHLKCKSDERDPRAVTISVYAMTHGLAEMLVAGTIQPRFIGASDTKGIVKKTLEMVQI